MKIFDDPLKFDSSDSGDAALRQLFVNVAANVMSDLVGWSCVKV